MNPIRTASTARVFGLAMAAVVAGCATPAPRQAQVVSMSSHAPAPAADFPAAGGIWRLNDGEFNALGPLPPEPEPGEANPVPARHSRLPAESREYRSGSYFIPLPALFYHGPRFSFSYGYPGYWPRYPFAPYPRGYSRAWRYRTR